MCLLCFTDVSHIEHNIHLIVDIPEAAAKLWCVWMKEGVKDFIPATKQQN